MKQLIKQLLREGLVDELSTMAKPVYGSGTEHKLYSSKTNPNVLYKVGKRTGVEKWVKLFRSNVSIFPKIYKVGNLDERLMYVQIEKLNTNRAENEWEQIAIELLNLNILTKYYNGVEKVRALASLYIDILSGGIEYEEVYHALEGTPKLQQLFLNWVLFISKATDYVENNGYRGLDLHSGNFAYDSSGNIKCVDV